MEREPYQYDNNEALDAETNRELKIVHAHLNKLKALYTESERELELLKRERLEEQLVSEKRFNTIENRLDRFEDAMKNVERMLGKIDSNTDATRKIVLQLLGGGVITALITFVFKFFTP